MKLLLGFIGLTAVIAIASSAFTTSLQPIGIPTNDWSPSNSEQNHRVLKEQTDQSYIVFKVKTQSNKSFKVAAYPYENIWKLKKRIEAI